MITGIARTGPLNRMTDGIPRSDALGDENHEITILRALNSQLCTIDERERVTTLWAQGDEVLGAVRKRIIPVQLHQADILGDITPAASLHSLKKSGKYPVNSEMCRDTWTHVLSFHVCLGVYYRERCDREF